MQNNLTSGASINLQQAIEWAVAELNSGDIYFGHGTDNAVDEAAYLVSYAAGLTPYFSDEELIQDLTAQQISILKELVQQRITSRLPAAYLTHEAWYMGVPFYVDKNVLVPRSPISELVAEYFQPWIEEDKIHRILDLCTGSGCIAVLCAMAFPVAKVDATDISKAALAIANKNVKRHQLENRVSVIESDLFSSLDGNKYDVIVSNPPYVDAQDMHDLPDEYRHEPEMALAAGDDGLDLVIPMLCDALNYINPHGIIIIEVGNSAEALQKLFPDIPFMWLDFEHGGDGVFMLDAKQLNEYHQAFETERNKRN